MDGATSIPAEDLGERQNLSITVPHWHSRSFTAAQTTQEGTRCFLLICHFLPCACLCKVLLRASPALSPNVTVFLFICPATWPSNLFIIFVLFARGETETDGLHTVHLHKRQVKLRKVGQRLCQAVFQLPNPSSFVLMFLLQKCLYLVLCARVSVEELEKAQWVGLPYQDEVPCSVRQVSRRWEAKWTPGTWAGHTSEGHTPELALHTHPITWRSKEKRNHLTLKISLLILSGMEDHAAACCIFDPSCLLYCFVW